MNRMVRQSGIGRTWAQGLSVLMTALLLALSLGVSSAWAEPTAVTNEANEADSETPSGDSAAVANNSAAAADGNLVNPQQLPDSSFIYDTSIYDLATSDTYYANQTVQITGEVVGDLIHGEDEDGYCWITVSALPTAKAASMQVYVTRAMAESIDSYGNYHVTGSTVTVMGTFNLVCDQHQGLSDVHASSLTVTEPGSVNQMDVPVSAFIVGFVLVALGFVLVVANNHLRERLR